MPMDFPDFTSIKNRAKQRRFREPEENETEEDYRQSFAKFMDSVDMIEANEIRNKVGWNKWTDNQKMVSFLDTIMVKGV